MPGAADARSKPPADTLDPSVEDKKEVDADATAVPSSPEAAAAKAEEEHQAKGEATPTKSNKTKAVGFASSNPKHDDDDDDVDEEKEVDKDEEEEGEEADPILEPNDSFTLDNRDSLNYQKLLDKVQPQGRRGRFSVKDLMKFIPSTLNKNCLVIYKYPYHLQLLHSAFVCGDWVYACCVSWGEWMITG